ncbi:zinc finger TRAF-type-containing protein 1 isoform X4 [Callorhinus ursinus]|uniref:zinc finger TRAF-type-containing protein 1 isoform X4 n=1 Tax=Callorhinus ursinus TaxID=34884 RepID=UPI003CCFFEFB
MRDSIPGPQDHDLSRRQSLNQLSHPGAQGPFLLSSGSVCLSWPAGPSAAGAGGAGWCVRVCTSCRSVSSSPFPSSQCTNGHLMCAGCFIHLLADARLKEEQATCPNCRCEISKSLCCRNLAVEKAVSELPSECGFCLRQFPRSLLERHQKEECQDRVTQCKYKRIGCPWHGPFHELTVHEAACAHPTKTGNELMEILDEMDQSHRKEMQLYNSIFSLLSFEKIGYTGPSS